MTPARPCELSWLKVERYALGELSPVDAQAIEAHLATCAACAAMVATIEGDRRPLPPLQLPEPAWWERLPGARSLSRVPLEVRLGAPLAAAAALALVVLGPGSQGPIDPAHAPGAEVQVKGGTVAVSLLRQRDNRLSRNPDTYRPGDNVEVRLTCPPEDTAAVVVLEGTARRLLIEGVPCGNRVMGAGISLTGEEAQAICAVVGEDPVSDEALRQRAACRVLAPEG